MRFAYADPPYPGTSAKYYRDRPGFAGEVDHAQLVASLMDGRYDGWALSTSAKALRDILGLCPSTARVCAWVKPIGTCPLTFGLHNTWEPLIVVGGRQRRPGKRDWLRAMPARGWGDLPGRKPLAFCAWLFDCLGMVAGDTLDDLFPGSRAVERAWAEVSRRSSATSLLEDGDASAGAGADASFTASDDVVDVVSFTPGGCAPPRSELAPRAPRNGFSAEDFRTVERALATGLPIVPRRPGDSNP